MGSHYTNGFKKCPNCGFEWNSRDHFLMDARLDIIGYQTNFKQLTSGLFYFNHNCRGTLTIKASVFIDLYDGPVFQDRATGAKECPGHCLHRNDLEPCPAQCECSYIREIMQIIKAYSNYHSSSKAPDSATEQNPMVHAGI